MLILILLIMVTSGFLIGLFDDVEDPNEPFEQTIESHEDIQFNPWTDEWYGEGPWWKKW